ncbi:MAG TPA: hypothetical protein VNE58_00375 [Casimicrobiaceae bacterium]|nr:hypothetical protein [Casimicrobiaceae bacterium]
MSANADWLPWLILGAVALFVIGIVLRMVLAARFPKNYHEWAREKRETFAARNAEFDRDNKNSEK